MLRKRFDVNKMVCGKWRRKRIESIRQGINKLFISFLVPFRFDFGTCFLSATQNISFFTRKLLLLFARRLFSDYSIFFVEIFSGNPPHINEETL